MPLEPEAQRLAWIVAAVVMLWISEALPLAVTALLGAPYFLWLLARHRRGEAL